MLGAKFPRALRLSIYSIVFSCTVISAGQTKLDKKLIKKAKKVYGQAFTGTISYATGANEVVPSPQATGDETQTIGARTGDIASGVILMESKGSLYLDTRPCNGHVLTFSRPYRKTKLSTVSCGGKQLDTYQIEEKRK